MGKRYAAGTSVPVDRTRAEIERILERFKADSFGYFTEPRRVMIAFRCNGRNVRFDLPIPDKATAKNQDHWAAVVREKWRALALCIKSKLVSVEAGVETFEEAFMAHVVMPDGRTVGEHALPLVARSYESGESIPLIPPPGRAP